MYEQLLIDCRSLSIELTVNNILALTYVHLFFCALVFRFNAIFGFLYE